MRHHHLHLSTPVLALPGRTVWICCVLLGLLSACSQGDPAASGRELLAKGDYQGAVIEFKNAVQAQPESAEARVLLADALERVGDITGAEQQLVRAVANGGDENVLVPRIALMLLDRGDHEKLVREFKDRKLASREADSTLRATVALAAVGLRRIPLAQAQLEAVVDTPAVAIARAQLLVASGKLPEAVSQLGSVRAEAATPWWVLRAASRIAVAGGDGARGLELLRLAHEAVPWNRGVTGEYGQALIGAGKVEQAAAIRDQLRKKAPNQFWTVYLDALLLARDGRTDASHAAALKVLAVAPDHAPTVLLAASAELQSGDVAMADKRLQALVHKEPDSLPALRLLAQSQYRLGKLAEATEIVERGLRLAPGDAQLFALRAELEWARGERSQAATTLAAVLDRRPDDASTQLRLAEMKAALGQRAEASQLLERASVAGVRDSVLHDRIVAASLRMGDVAQARRVADRGVEANPADPRARLALAAVQHAQKDAAGAWATTLAVLDAAPTQPQALTVLAAMSRTPQQRDETLARYARAFDARPESAQVFLQYADLLRLAPKPAHTRLAVLERGVTALPVVVALREALVEEYLRAGDVDKALSVAQSGEATHNAPAAAGALLAATYERIGKTQLATESYRKLAANYPQRAEWRLALARLEAAANRRSEATTILRALITERPFDISAYLALVELSMKDNPDEALSIARQMGRRDEFKGAALLLEGDILAGLGKPDAALKQFALASKAGAESLAALRIVRLLDGEGRRAAADQEMAGALKRFSSDPSIVSAAAGRALAAGDAARAVGLLQPLAARPGVSAVLLNDLAWAQVQAGQPQALATAKRAATAMPNNANVLDTLAMAQVAAGQRADAIANLRVACNLSPLSALPRLHLSEQLLASGDRSGASAEVQKVDAGQLGEKDRAALAKLKTALGGL